MSLDKQTSSSAPSEQWGAWGPLAEEKAPPASGTPLEKGASQGNVHQAAAMLQSSYPGYPTASPSPGLSLWSPSQPYASYPAPVWGYPPAASLPRRSQDSYLQAIAIITLVCSSVSLLVGLYLMFSMVIFSILMLSGTSASSSSGTTLSTVIILYLVIGGCFLFAGGMGLYHSIRSLVKKPSAFFALPNLWLYVLFYLVVAATGLALHASGDDVNMPLLAGALVFLVAILPALLYSGWAAFRLRSVVRITFRRTLMALASGMTFVFILALICEALLVFAFAFTPPIHCLTSSSTSSCDSSNLVPPLTFLVFLLIAIIDELFKSTILALLMKKVSTSGEAFLLGLACGAGLGIAEAGIVSVIASTNWPVLLLAGCSLILMQSFSGALTSVGWFYLMNTRERRVRRAGLLWLLAILFHGVFWLLLFTTPLLQSAGIPVDSVAWNIGPVTITPVGLICLAGFVVGLAIFIVVLERMRKALSKAPVSVSASQ